MEVTPVFRKNLDIHTRLVVNQGGSRSSKTYSIAQLFVKRSFEWDGKTIAICRKTLPALKASVMRDFFEILHDMGLYNEAFHNKTENQYMLNGNLFEFFAVDEQQKVRGRKRDILWMNEANEFKYEDFKQLAMRTSGQIYLDYNPSDEFHWIYEFVLTRQDCTFILSTYLDNPFLSGEIVKEIESYKLLDPNHWRIYGLGERGINEAAIYSHFELINGMPKDDFFDDVTYGLDFGFNNKTALVKNGIRDKQVYSDEKLYKSGLTNSELIMHMLGWDRMTDEMKDKADRAGKSESDFPDLGISFKHIIYADAAEPQRIQEIKEAGFWIVSADKGKDSVSKGIDLMKASRWFITKESVNVIKEARAYKWKVRDEHVTDEPVKVNDHAMDAIRYAVYTNFNKPFVGFV